MTFSRIFVAFVAALILCAFGHAATADASVSPRQVQHLVNVERAKHGLRAVHWDARLAHASRRHSAVMVRLHFFDHVGADGNPAARAKAAGFTPGARLWSVGEILFTGTGSRGSARAAISGWLHSPPHRAIMLSPRFKRAGFGIVHGTPNLGANGNTFTGVFGVR